jgi:hypothetical protein
MRSIFVPRHLLHTQRRGLVVYAGDPFQVSLTKLRSEIVKRENARTLAFIESHLSKIQVPIEALKEDLLENAKQIETAPVKTSYAINLSRMLQATPPYTLYVSNQVPTDFAQEIKFDGSMYIPKKHLETILLNNKCIKELDRIQNELTAAFPNASIQPSIDIYAFGMYIKYNISYTTGFLEDPVVYPSVDSTK